MKKLIHFFISSMIFLFASSCSKDEAIISGTVSDNQPSAIFLVADRWTNEGNGVFENNFSGVFFSGNANGSSGDPNVYLVLSDKELLIGSTGIQFMGGELKASKQGMDLNVSYKIYSPNSVLPFQILRLKVVR